MTGKGFVAAAKRATYKFAAEPMPVVQRVSYVPGELIVRYKSDALQLAAAIVRERGPKGFSKGIKALPEELSKSIQYLAENAGMTLSRSLFGVNRTGRVLGELAGKGVRAVVNSSVKNVIRTVAETPHEDLAGYSMIKVDPRQVSEQLLKLLRGSPFVEFAEQMPARWIAAEPPRKAKDSKSMRLPKGEQWALNAIKWHLARKPQKADCQGISVAVLDTGVDRKHPALRGVIKRYDHSGQSEADLAEHGTHVCGIIAGASRNKPQFNGVAECRLKVWKIFDDKKVGGRYWVNGENYLRALGLLADEGCQVVNLSIGGYETSMTETNLISRLIQKNIVVVAAMGNEKQEGNPYEYPAALPGVVAVGSIGQSLAHSPFSNTGHHITLVAPGEEVVSAMPRGRYEALDGTSMATPHVSGAVAMLMARNKTMTSAQILARLQVTAKKIPKMRKKTFTSFYGHGLLDLEHLLDL